MSVFRLAMAAVALSRHPVVRAGLKAAPLVLNDRTRAAAAQGVLNTAYMAGKLARRVIPPR
jgi:hypothetical protein